MRYLYLTSYIPSFDLLSVLSSSWCRVDLSKTICYLSYQHLGRQEHLTPTLHIFLSSPHPSPLFFLFIHSRPFLSCISKSLFPTRPLGHDTTLPFEGLNENHNHQMAQSAQYCCLREQPRSWSQRTDAEEYR